MEILGTNIAVDPKRLRWVQVVSNVPPIGVLCAEAIELVGAKVERPIIYDVEMDNFGAA